MLKRLDSINEHVGRLSAWLATVLVIIVVANVMLRYCFNSGQIWLSELSWHVYAAMFLLGGAYALKHNRHVRVDVFYSRWSSTTKGIVDLIGYIFFLIPFCLMGMITAWPYAMRSLTRNEHSNEASGLPARYIIKFVIVVAFALLLIQAVVEVLRIIQKRLNTKSI
ncbi:MAG: TRAP transporter small permease subunit [Bacteroidia bacterium]